MARYSSKERIGVQRFALLVEEHSDWIFREQTIADVGVDAIIEQTINDDPNGALIACQIKSGNGNFSSTKDGKLVYYVSNIHREYWINHDLPIILILVDDNGIIYWGLLNHKTIKKTKLRFKIEIPKYQKLSSKNINDVFEIVLHSKNPRDLVVDEIEADDNDSLRDNIFSIHTAFDAMLNIEKAFKYHSKHLGIITEDLAYYNEKGRDNNRKNINNQIDKMATQNNMLGKRIESEIEVIAKGVTTSLLSMRKYFLKIGIENIPPSELFIIQSSLLELFVILNRSSEQFNLFNETISQETKPKGRINFKELKKSKVYLSNILTLLEEEFDNIAVLAKALLEVLKNNSQEIENTTTQ